MVTFSKRLKELRTEKNLTLEDLANTLGTTKSTISRYENELRIPNSDFINDVADYFKVSTDYLLGKSDIKNPYIDVEQLPTSFNTAEEAMQFILKDNNIMAHGGFDINKLTDDEKIQFANELLEQLKLVSYKYKKP